MIDISRRRLLVGTTSLVAAPSILRAQDGFPSRPIKFIVPYTPAGATDNISRIICGKMSELAGQQVVIEPRGGGLVPATRKEGSSWRSMLAGDSSVIQICVAVRPEAARVFTLGAWPSMVTMALPFLS